MSLPRRPSPHANIFDQLILALLRLRPKSWLSRPTEETLMAIARPHRGDPNNPKLPDIPSLERGRTLLKDNQPAEALLLFGQLIQSHPNNAWAWHGRGDALQYLNQFERAEHAFQRATALNPREALHYAGLGNARKGVGDKTGSDQAWRRALALDPGVQWMRWED